MHDLVLRGGTVVARAGTARADVLVDGGIIAALLRPGEAADARESIDVTGRLLLPGLVDAHVHLREPGLTHKEDFATGTRAAIAGGVTTVLVMPTDDPWTETAVHFADKRRLAEGRIACDVGLQVSVGRDLRDLEALAARGAVSFELFTADVPEAFLHDTAPRLERAMAAVRDASGLAAVSPGNQALLTDRLARLHPGRSTPADYTATRPPLGEAIGIATALAVAASTGAAVHIRQTSAGSAIDVFRRLKSLADVSIETSPQCLLFTAEDYGRLGPLLKASPPLRSADDVALLHAALTDGTIDMVATDHAPHTMVEKMAVPDDFAAVPGGMPGVQTLLWAMLHLVDRRVIALADVARLCAESPAHRFGLGTRKGSIAQGLDADILVIDPHRSTTVRNVDQISKAGYTVLDGLTVPFHLERVLLQGREVLGPAGLSMAPSGRVLAAERRRP